MMNASKPWAAGLGTVLLLAAGAAVRAQEAGGTKPAYTLPEYNAYKACTDTTPAAARAKCLENFATTYPNPALLIYAYPLAYQTYNELKNYPKVIEFVDKTLALGDKVEVGVRYQALVQRAVAYNNLPSPDATQVAKAHQAALDGLKALNELKKPDNVDDKTFADQKKPAVILFNTTAGTTALAMKDYPAAVEAFKAVLALNPDDPVANYDLGRAYLGTNPPQQMDAFWAIARAVGSKKATEQQVKQLRPYLRNLLVNYQQPNCENLIDAQMNELIQLASSSTERPASYSFPSATELQNTATGMTIASVISDLKAGGEKAKLTWLAACGLEFPNVPGKAIEVKAETDYVDLGVAFATSDAEFEAAKTADMDVKVLSQPEAARIEKDSLVQFTATLTSFDPDPFMLHWDKGRVNPENIPAEKNPPKRPPAHHAPPHHNPSQ
jgi:tetratricopeptide (TPR) repeat protein